MLAETETEPAADAALIRRSFATAARDPTALAAAFYRRLFDAEPGLRVLFPAEMEGQERKLAAMLAAVVARIDDWPALAPAVADLGRRHRALGVRAEHFRPVVAALIAALAERSGAPLDQDAETAWRRAIGRIAAAMIEVWACSSGRSQASGWRGHEAARSGRQRKRRSRIGRLGIIARSQSVSTEPRRAPVSALPAIGAGSRRPRRGYPRRPARRVRAPASAISSV